MILCKAISLADLKEAPGQVVVLAPADQRAETKLKKAEGKTFGVEARRGRSLKQHNLYFAILDTVFENQERFRSAEELRAATMLAIGFTKLRKRFDDSVYAVPRSMDFRLPQDEFQSQVFDPSVDLWCREFGYEREELLSA